jgi:hypothetical protein
MKIGFLLCALLLLAGIQTAFADDEPKDKSSYEALVERAKSGDKTVDFKELRLQYAASPGFHHGPDTDSQKKAMMAALNSKDFTGALKNADVVLASDYVDMDAHFVEYIANRELKAVDQAGLHKFVLQGLLKSVTDSGDGKTPETAFQVIEVHEEYVVLRFMGVGMPWSQSLLRKNDHSYDLIKFEDPASKQEITVYFNVDIPVKHGL